MKKNFKILRLILAILSLVTTGCALDLAAEASRGKITIAVKPATRPADGGSVTLSVANAAQEK